MSGHSKWAKIKRQKGSEDAKKGKIFTKLGNAIAIAAKNGGDPNMNPALALAIDKAKAANMPHANIEKSIKRGTGELGGEQILELMFEGYGPGGIGIIVETATDNRNRTTSEVRTAFSKNGGNLAESGSVAFQFTRLGVITIKSGADPDTTMLSVLDMGAKDVVEAEEELIIYTDLKDLHSVKENIIASGIEVVDADPQYVANDVIEVTDSTQAQKVIKLMDAVEEIEDVTNTYSNFDIDETKVKL